MFFVSLSSVRGGKSTGKEGKRTFSDTSRRKPLIFFGCFPCTVVGQLFHIIFTAASFQLFMK